MAKLICIPNNCCEIWEMPVLPWVCLMKEKLDGGNWGKAGVSYINKWKERIGGVGGKGGRANI